MLQLTLKSPLGRDISDFSMFPTESEILLPPHMSFKVTGILYQNDLVILTCDHQNLSDLPVTTSGTTNVAQI
jgi:hypothetical protein